MSEELIKLEYTHLARGPTPVLFWIGIACSIVPAVVGVLCLVGYWLSESSDIAFFGFGWLGLGGLLTFIAICIGFAYRQSSRTAGQDAAALRRSRVLTILPLLNIPLAIVCAGVGSMLFHSPRAEFVIENRTEYPVESGQVIFGSTLIPFMKIEPSGVARHKLRLHGFGKMQIEYVRGGATHRIKLLENSDEDDFWQRPLTITITIDKEETRMRH